LKNSLKFEKYFLSSYIFHQFLDATYTIEKRTSFEEQNPADSTTWPDDEQESMPQIVIAQDQPSIFENFPF
jgi:hypothetical protein